MKTNYLLSISFVLILFVACKKEKQIEDQKPNILFLIADDMGYADLECYGGVSNTPNINKLAEKGILFTDFYAAAPNCSPSRAGLMTGKSPSKLGMYSYRPPNHPMHLRSDEVTIAEVLQKEGYNTSHIGKWHLSCLPQDEELNQPQPHEQGFEYSLGTENNAQPSHLNPINFVRNGERLEEQKGYSCQILANEAIHWLDNQQKSEHPFFMYVAFHEPHAKVASPPNLVEKYKEFGKKDSEYLANIENLDLAVGRILDYLKENELFENTFIVFASDNGSYRQASNGNLKAVKSYVYEGGIRVPGIVSWPKLERENIKINEPAGFVDLMPTICDILNVNPFDEEELDGTSILSLMKDEAFERKSPLYWYFYRTSPEMAMRVGDLMILGKDFDTVPRTHRFSSTDMDYIKEMNFVEYELYDLSKDIGERENLIEQHSHSEIYKASINNKLKEIQDFGYHWKDLPAASGTKKMKSNWVKFK